MNQVKAGLYLSSHLHLTLSSSLACFLFFLFQIDPVHLNPYLKLCIYGNHAETPGSIEMEADGRCVGRGEEGVGRGVKAREHAGGGGGECSFRETMLPEETGLLFPTV